MVWIDIDRPPMRKCIGTATFGFRIPISSCACLPSMVKTPPTGTKSTSIGNSSAIVSVVEHVAQVAQMAEHHAVEHEPEDVDLAPLGPVAVVVVGRHSPDLHAFFDAPARFPDALEIAPDDARAVMVEVLVTDEHDVRPHDRRLDTDRLSVQMR